MASVQLLRLAMEKNAEENIIVKLNFATKYIRLILAYGPHGCQSKQVIDDFYNQVIIQVDKDLIKGDSIMLAGDFNAKLGRSHIPSDVYDIRPNGKIFLSILQTYDCNGFEFIGSVHWSTHKS